MFGEEREREVQGSFIGQGRFYAFDAALIDTIHCRLLKNRSDFCLQSNDNEIHVLNYLTQSSSVYDNMTLCVSFYAIAYYSLLFPDLFMEQQNQLLSYGELQWCYPCAVWIDLRRF